MPDHQQPSLRLHPKKGGIPTAPDRSPYLPTSHASDPRGLTHAAIADLSCISAIYRLNAELSFCRRFSRAAPRRCFASCLPVCHVRDQAPSPTRPSGLGCSLAHDRDAPMSCQDIPRRQSSSRLIRPFAKANVFGDGFIRSGDRPSACPDALRSVFNRKRAAWGSWSMTGKHVVPSPANT